MIKLLDLLKEDSPFVPRGSKEEREKDHNMATQNKIQQYIKDGMEGDLDLSESPITSLPSNLTKVGGDLDLYSTPITSLPNNLIVGGDLDLSYTLIVSLPSNLVVGDNLYMAYTLITSLPSNLKISGDLILKNTPLSKKYSEADIRAMVPNFKGKILI